MKHRATKPCSRWSPLSRRVAHETIADCGKSSTCCRRFGFRICYHTFHRSRTGLDFCRGKAVLHVSASKGEGFESSIAPLFQTAPAETNRFMFWHKPKPGVNPEWKQPTEPLQMPFPEWRDWTKEADTNKIGPTDVHYYLTTGAFA